MGVRTDTAVAVACVLVCVVFLAAAPRARAIRMLTRTDRGQHNVFVYVEETDLDVVAHHNIVGLGDTAQYECGSAPELHRVLGDTILGNTRNHAPLVVDTTVPTLTTPFAPWAMSQTFVMPGDARYCWDEGREVVYIGTGMFRHSAVRQAHDSSELRNGKGVLGLAVPGGAWGPWGWSNATMSFGHAREQRGWIGFNVTAAHPFAADRDFLGAPTLVVDTHCRLRMSLVRMTVGAETWAFADAVFTPEYPFVDVPPAVWDRLVEGRNINAHNMDSLRALGPVTLDVRGTPGLERAPIVVLQGDDLVTRRQRLGASEDWAAFLVLRRSTTSTMRIGCAALRASFFLDAASFELAPPELAATRLGTVRTSFAHIPAVELVTPWNAFVFSPLLMLVFFMWLLNHAIADDGSAADGTPDTIGAMIHAPTATAAATMPGAHLGLGSGSGVRMGRSAFLAGVSQGWIARCIESVGCITAAAATFFNAQYWHLDQRYAFLTSEELLPWGSMFQFGCMWLVLFWAAICLVLIAAETHVVRRAKRRSTLQRQQRVFVLPPHGHARAGATDAEEPPPLSHSGNAAAILPLAVVTQDGGHNSYILSTVTVWNMHVMIRSMGFVYAVLPALCCTMLEGPANGHSVYIVLGVAITTMLMPVADLVGLVRLLAQDAIVRHHPTSWWNIGQVAAFVLTGMCVVPFVMALLVEPLIGTILREFTPTVLWVITATILLFVATVPIFGYSIFNNGVLGNQPSKQE